MYDDIKEGSTIRVKLADGSQHEALVVRVGHADHHGWAMLTLAIDGQPLSYMPLPVRMLADVAVRIAS